jgi:hypothetical protein
MTDIFPLEVKPPSLRAVVAIIKDNGGSAPLSQIADESRMGIAELFPIIEAGKMLDIMTVKNGVVTLTDILKTSNPRELKKVLNALMPKLEPIKSIISHLKKAKKASTEELFDMLLKKGLVTQINRHSDIADFRRQLLSLLIRTELCSYEHEKDYWKLI